MRILTLLLFTSLCLPSVNLSAEIKKGDKLQMLVNLHPDHNKKLLYSINYQLPSLMPMCSEIIVKKISKKTLVFTYKNMQYKYAYDKHTRKSGIVFQEYLTHFLGKKCDNKKVKRLSKIDQDGIRTGRPAVGMSKAGILFAMGRPPFHANPSLDVSTWMYWRNRFKRVAIEFDAKNKVSNIRN